MSESAAKEVVVVTFQEHLANWMAEEIDFGGHPTTRAGVYAWFKENLYPERAAELWLLGYENTHPTRADLSRQLVAETEKSGRDV